ncbi:MAG: type II secretion system F family protein [Gemmatimonadota bacterium]
MTIADILAIGVPMLAGAFTVLRSSRRLFAGCGPGRLGRAIGRFHESAHDKSIAMGLFRFPGACLVPSMRGWLAGEAVFLGVLATALRHDHSLAGCLSATAAAALLGGSAVYLAVRDQARRQIDAVQASLPVASFLMALLLEAGMGSYAALREATRALPAGPLGRELEELARSRAIGIPRGEAIERSRNRVPLDEYRTFLNLIDQGERLGVGLSQALLEHSSKMMEAQAHRAETVAQQAAVKLLFPLVAFIFPAVFLVILSPVILALLAMLGT